MCGLEYFMKVEVELGRRKAVTWQDRVVSIDYL